jgi:hypothetical protein
MPSEDTYRAMTSEDYDRDSMRYSDLIRVHISGSVIIIKNYEL